MIGYFLVWKIPSRSPKLSMLTRKVAREPEREIVLSTQKRRDVCGWDTQRQRRERQETCMTHTHAHTHKQTNARTDIDRQGI